MAHQIYSVSANSAIMAQHTMSLRKLQTALAIYAALAIAGAFLVRGDIRIQAVLWILLAGLAIKTWAAYKMHQ